jgi:hypothetical protein
MVEALMIWVPMCVGVFGAAWFRSRNTKEEDIF